MKRVAFFASTVMTVGIMSLMHTGCGGGESEFPEPDANGNGASSGESTPITTPNGNSSSGGDAGQRTPPASLAECATSTLGGNLLPMQLTLLLDTSSSMCLVGEPPNQTFDCANPSTRWQATTAALRTFLTAPGSAGLTIAITRFGPVDSFNPNTVATNRCNANQYETPVYQPKELPWQEAEAAELNTAIFIETSNGDATQTQTAAVIGGGTTYTLAEKARLAGQKGVAMLLVSDGIPAGCDPASPTAGTDVDRNLAYTAAKAANDAGLKLYVLNLGGQEDVLQEIAENGGTEAIRISGTDTSEIVSKLNQIRGETLSCEFAIPKPEVGNPDYKQMNLGWTAQAGGTPEVLVQSADCSQGRGWQYDNPDAPTSIRLCGAICDEVLASTGGQIDVVLGCETRTGPVN